MMNLIKLQNQLKDLSDRQLGEQMQSGTAPQFLVLSEMQRRQKMRNEAKASNDAPQATVAEELSQASMMEGQGIAGLPMEPPSFADGGIVSFAAGGNTKPKKSKRYTAPTKAKAKAEEQKPQEGPVRNAKGETLQQVLKRLGVPDYYAEFPITDEDGSLGWSIGTRGDSVDGAAVDISTRIMADPKEFEELRPFVTAPTETKAKRGRASVKPNELPPASPVPAITPPVAAPAQVQVVPRPAPLDAAELSAPGSRAVASPASAAPAGVGALLGSPAGTRGVEGGVDGGTGSELSAPGSRAVASPASAPPAGVGALLGSPAGTRGVEGGVGGGMGAELSAPSGVRASARKAVPPTGLLDLLSGERGRRSVESSTAAPSTGAQLSNEEVYASSDMDEAPGMTLYTGGPRATTMYEIPGVLPPGMYTERQLKEILGEKYDPKAASPLAFVNGGELPKEFDPKTYKLFRDTGWTGFGETYTVKSADGTEYEVPKELAMQNYPHAFKNGAFQTKPDPKADAPWYQRWGLTPSAPPGVTMMDPASVPAGATTMGQQVKRQDTSVGAMQDEYRKMLQGEIGITMPTTPPVDQTPSGRANLIPGAAPVAPVTPATATPATTTKRVQVGSKPGPKLDVKPGTQPALTNVMPLTGGTKAYESMLLGHEPPKYNTDKETALLKKMQDKLDARSDEPFNMALMQAGLAMMAGTSPHAMVNMGAGGIQGLKAYAEGKKDIRDLEKEITNAELAMEKAAKENDWKTYESKSERLKALYDMAHNTDVLAEQTKYHTGMIDVQKEQAKAHGKSLDRAERAERGRYFAQRANDLTEQIKIEMDPKVKAALIDQRDQAMATWAELAGIKLGAPTPAPSTSGFKVLGSKPTP